MRSLWARITGADKRGGGKLPLQQVSSLGRGFDADIAHPYGYYADLPDDTWLLMITPTVGIPLNFENPDDSERGEPTFFHPTTKTRIIARNDGSLDIISDTAVNITAPLTTIDGDLTVTGDTTLSATVTSNGKDISDTHTHGGSATAPNGPVSNTGAVT